MLQIIIDRRRYHCKACEIHVANLNFKHVSVRHKHIVNYTWVTWSKQYDTLGEHQLFVFAYLGWL